MNPDDKEDLQKITPYSIGYRDGILFAIRELIECIEKDKNITETRLILEAIRKDLDIFVKYGLDCKIVFTEHDKKRKPTKAKLYSPTDKILITKLGPRSHREIIDLVQQVNEQIQSEKDDTIKILEEKIRQLEKAKEM